MAIGLASIDHLVVVMLENRSFDHLLGFLYHDGGNISPAGDAFAGLTGSESCPGPDGSPVSVYPITSQTPNAYFMPGTDPGEGYTNTNEQLFGVAPAPASRTVPSNRLCDQLRPNDRGQSQGRSERAPGDHRSDDHGLLRC